MKHEFRKSGSPVWSLCPWERGGASPYSSMILVLGAGVGVGVGAKIKSCIHSQGP